MPSTNEVLIIVTNVGEYERVGFRTGLWLGELTHFWNVAEKAGFQMDVASPSGGYVPIDPESLAHAVLKEALLTSAIRTGSSRTGLRTRCRTSPGPGAGSPSIGKAIW